MGKATRRRGAQAAESGALEVLQGGAEQQAAQAEAPPGPSEHDVTQALAVARQQRSEACLAEIRACLDRYQCVLVPTIVLSGNAPQQAGINCVAK